MNDLISCEACYVCCVSIIIVQLESDCVQAACCEAGRQHAAVRRAAGGGRGAQAARQEVPQQDADVGAVRTDPGSAGQAARDARLGLGAVNTAANTIQRAYRRYSMMKKFAAITSAAQGKMKNRLSRRFQGGPGHTSNMFYYTAEFAAATPGVLRRNIATFRFLLNISLLAYPYYYHVNNHFVVIAYYVMIMVQIFIHFILYARNIHALTFRYAFWRCLCHRSDTGSCCPEVPASLCVSLSSSGAVEEAKECD